MKGWGTLLEAMLFTRIRIDFGLVGYGSRRGKMTHKNRKQFEIFLICSPGLSLLMAEGFFLMYM
jgi:hypothetical protein